MCVCPHNEVRWKPRSYIWNLSSWHIVRQILRRHYLYISVFRHRSRLNFPSHWICGFRGYLANSTCSIVNTEHFGRCFVRCFCIWCLTSVFYVLICSGKIITFLYLALHDGIVEQWCLVWLALQCVLRHSVWAHPILQGHKSLVLLGAFLPPVNLMLPFVAVCVLSLTMTGFHLLSASFYP